MTPDLAEYYGRDPYAELVHSFTHPAAMAAVARLYGLSPVDPAQARVLDLGEPGDRLLLVLETALLQCGHGGRERVIASGVRAAADGDQQGDGQQQ